MLRIGNCIFPSFLMELVLGPHHTFPDTIDHILGLFHPPLGIVEGGQKPTPAGNRIKNFQHPFTLCNRCVGRPDLQGQEVLTLGPFHVVFLPDFVTAVTVMEYVVFFLPVSVGFTVPPAFTEIVFVMIAPLADFN